MKKRDKMKNDNGNRTFVKITNKDIFVKIEVLEQKLDDKTEILRKKLDEFCGVNQVQHEKLNGRTKLALWMGGTGLTLFGLILGFVLAHLSGKI